MSGGHDHIVVLGRECDHHALVLFHLVWVGCEGMLTDVIEAGEPLAAMADERPLSGVLPRRVGTMHVLVGEADDMKTSERTHLMCLIKC